MRNVTESLAVQLEKAQDQLVVALRPLGLQLLNIIIPAVEAGVPAVQALAQAFASLPQPIQLTAIALASLFAILGPGLNLFGGAIQALQVIQVARLAQGLQTTTAAATEAATSASLFTRSLIALRAALAATTTFLFTTPAGWAVLAAGTLAAVAAFAAFNDQQQEAIEKADALKLDDLTKQFENIARLRDQLAQADQLTGAQANLNAEQARFAAILATLPPRQREVIDALGGQKEKVEELRQTLRETLKEQSEIARAQQIRIVAGIAARQQEIDTINTKTRR